MSNTAGKVPVVNERETIVFDVDIKKVINIGIQENVDLTKGRDAVASLISRQ